MAQATGLSRRSVDEAIKQGRVSVNGHIALLGLTLGQSDQVSLDNQPISALASKTTLLINKPEGYVCSRNGQGAPTLYDLIPKKYSKLKSVGRLDKDSSGIIVLTDDGQLAHQLSHPSFNKLKVYYVKLDQPLQQADLIKIDTGRVILDGKPSNMKVKIKSKDQKTVIVKIREGRNRQIRRTFQALDYRVVGLSREVFGPYSLNSLGSSRYIKLN